MLRKNILLWFVMIASLNNVAAWEWVKIASACTLSSVIYHGAIDSKRTLGLHDTLWQWGCKTKKYIVPAISTGCLMATAARLVNVSQIPADGVGKYVIAAMASGMLGGTLVLYTLGQKFNAYDQAKKVAHRIYTGASLLAVLCIIAERLYNNQ